MPRKSRVAVASRQHPIRNRLLPRHQPAGDQHRHHRQQGIGASQAIVRRRVRHPRHHLLHRHEQVIDLRAFSRAFDLVEQRLDRRAAFQPPISA
jgi:hypothetical protein